MQMGWIGQVVLLLLAVQYNTAEVSKTQCENTIQPLIFQTYPTCVRPSTLVQPPSTSTLGEQLRATLTAQEAKFLSFEEWKALNLKEQVGKGISQSIKTDIPATTPSSTSSHIRHPSVVSTSVEVATTTVETVTIDAEASGTQQSFKPDMSTISTKKDRFNHASFDCAASIVQSNKESKGSSNILKENKDYYMLNTCSAPSKFVTIELCNDILVDTIQLANFEYFCGVFKEISVQVAAKYPPGKEGWQELGTFTARPVREIQTFSVQNPLIWTRYVRIEMEKFYGNEFYCPLSLVRVFGKTMMEDYKQEGNPEDDLSTDLEEVGAEDASPGLLGDIERAAGNLVALSDQLAEGMQKHGITAHDQAVIVGIDVIESASGPVSQPSLVSSEAFSTVPDAQMPMCLPRQTSHPLIYPVETALPSTSAAHIASRMAQMTESITHNSTTTSSSTTMTDPISTKVMAPTTTPSNTASTVRSSVSLDSSHNNSIPSERVNEIKNSKAPFHNSPPTQESIYKQMSKRLSLLEANATLSLRYIESQSSLLAQSFSALSSVQARHLSNFLENVNVTMLQRISQLKQEYEYLYSDVSKNLQLARRRQEQDTAHVSRKLGTLSDDLVFFKRLGMFQSLLMLVLLGFLVTSRGAGIEIQTSLNRALSRRSASGLHSPITRSASPTTWRRHLRDQSVFGTSIYSFPVAQIERPFHSNTQSPQLGSDLKSENKDGDATDRSETEVFLRNSRLRSPLVHRPSSRSKDDMYDGDVNSAIRQRLYRGTSWSATEVMDREIIGHEEGFNHEQAHDSGEREDHNGDVANSELVHMGLGLILDTKSTDGALDYPTPGPEEN